MFEVLRRHFAVKLSPQTWRLIESVASPSNLVEKQSMIDLGAYKDKFSDSGQRILEHALNESRRRDQNYVAVEHILNALASEEADLFNATMRDLALDPRAVRVVIERRLETSRQHVGKGFKIAPDTTDLFKRAMERARAQGRRTIEETVISLALSQDERGLFVEVLKNLG